MSFKNATNYDHLKSYGVVPDFLQVAFRHTDHPTTRNLQVYLKTESPPEQHTNAPPTHTHTHINTADCVTQCKHTYPQNLRELKTMK